MNTLLVSLFALLATVLTLSPGWAREARCADLPVARNVAALGWDRAGLERARDAARTGGAAAFMVATGGKIVLQDGALDRPMLLASVRKSIASALIGQAIEAGALKRDDPISKFGVNDDVPLTETERAATVRDLISARSGVYLPTAAETDRMRSNRPARGAHAPGTFWFYNNWDFNAAGDVFERATAKSIFVAFERNIAKPLCMQDFDVYEHTYYSYDMASPRLPAYHMRLSPRDLMRFGMLYLQNGRWNGAQILSEAWVRESTAPISPTGYGAAILGAYGYMWWVTVPATEGSPSASPDLPQTPVGSYMASGSGGQQMIVIPALDTIILTRADTQPDQTGASTFRRSEEWERLVRLTLAARLSPLQVR